MADTFKTLIVTASTAPLARQIAASFGVGGAGMWTTPLSADGQEPATHFVSSGYIPEQFAALTGDAAAVYAHCQNVGIDCTLADVEAVIAAADVTEEEPFTAFGRLGLMIVQPTEGP